MRASGERKARVGVRNEETKRCEFYGDSLRSSLTPL